ncbi:MAG: hypothetical protein LBT08_01130, partial [Synergistaceae bacterium]|nr:hypothetical protein [Synergistaceae bacterium]
MTEADKKERPAPLLRWPPEAQHVSEFKKYLIIRKSEKPGAGYTINIRRGVIDKQLANTGWLVLISNHISSAKNALKI